MLRPKRSSLWDWHPRGLVAKSWGVAGAAASSVHVGECTGERGEDRGMVFFMRLNPNCWHSAAVKIQ